MTDGYVSWSLSDIRKLSYRERKHWLKRYLYKLELEYERQHQQNNSTQVRMGSTGQGVSFNGVPFR